MVEKKYFQYLSDDRITLIHAIEWVPECEVKAILQISHGMVEYVDRYDIFANYLAEHGIYVVGNDHLGHGRSIRSKEEYGFFADEDGNKVLIRDIHRLRKMTQEKYPNVPYFMLGHSMGSFLVRQYICCYPQGLNGAIIVGTSNRNRIELGSLMSFIKLMARFKGWRYRNHLLYKMVILDNNKVINNPRTTSDWLTKDEKIVDACFRDERSQFRFTLNGYYNLFLSMYQLTFDSYLNKMNKSLPVLLASGDVDRVGNLGKGVQEIYEDFKRLGMQDVTCKIYQGDRHEILNETDKEMVFGEICDWIMTHIDKH